MKEGAIPYLNLPEKSIPTKVITERSTNSIEKRITSNQVDFASKKDAPKKCYKDFEDLSKKIKLLKAVGWNIIQHDQIIQLVKYEASYEIPKYEINVDNSLNFTIRVYGWLLPETHEIYVKHFRSIQNITLSRLMQVLDLFKFCDGIPDSCISLSNLDSQIKKHIIYKTFQYNKEDDNINEDSARRLKYTVFCPL